MKFSVLLSVYKEENPLYLNDALRSIWDDQTLKPSQIVIVKDGPLTPQLDKVIDEWKARLSEIFLTVELYENLGLGMALNVGLRHCKYDLVARMDTDDISLPRRFEKQVAFMETNPDISASSGIIEEWDDLFSNLLNYRSLPQNNAEILEFAKKRNPISHPAVIYRKSVVTSVGGYPPFRKLQDYALWSLMLKNGYKFANINETLLKMRSGEKFLDRRGPGYFENEYDLFKYQKRIHFINFYEFLRNIGIRFLIRFSPNIFKKVLYKYARG
ncbi:MAG: glycosyltransferase [Treponema sp.]|nr:glycosyltransferase [Treponema sp.]